MWRQPLFALSAPSISPTTRFCRAPSPFPRRGNFMTLVTQPLFGFAAYFVFIPVTHLTVSQSDDGARVGPHLEQIGSWSWATSSFAWPSDWSAARRSTADCASSSVMAAVPVDTFTGLALAMSSHTPFPATPRWRRADRPPRGSSPTSTWAAQSCGSAVTHDAARVHSHRDRVGEVGDRSTAELDAILDRARHLAQHRSRLLEIVLRSSAEVRDDLPATATPVRPTRRDRHEREP